MEAILWRRIRRHVETGRETPKVDLKLTLQLDSSKDKMEFAKDVTAIANTPGGNGYIVIGVQDVKDRKTKDPQDYIAGFSWPQGPDQFECTANQILRVYVSKMPVIRYDEFPHPECGKNIGVITIERSFRKPHAFIRAGAGIEQHQVWIRRGTASFLASPSEILEMGENLALPTSIIINFSTHGLTDEQRKAIEKHTYIEEVIELRAHCGPEDAVDYVKGLLKQTGITVEEWSTKSIIIALPGFSPLTAVVLAYVHGLKGGFPKIIWLTPHPKDANRYILGDLFDLQGIRNKARVERASGGSLWE